MKSGALVSILGSFDSGSPKLGGAVVIGPWKIEGWYELLVDGKVFHWPESQLEVIE